MRRTLLLALLLTACGQTARNDSAVLPTDKEAVAVANDVVANDTVDHQAGQAVAPVQPPAPGTPGGLPDDRTPISEAPAAPDSAQAAADVVQRYYALVEAGKYADAWKLWDPTPPGLTAASFAQGFSKYSEYHAQIGKPGDVDAGAGQRYVTVPVVLYGRLKSGAEYHAKGSVTLHRVGDVDGATAAQKTWHIRTIETEPRS